MSKVVSILQRIIERAEPDITLKLEKVIYSPRHKHEICVLQLIGKNAWPRMTPQEILEDPQTIRGLSQEDVVKITRLDEKIKMRVKELKVLEIDVNGTIILEDKRGNVRRFSEKKLSENRKMLAKLSSLDAHDLGYRVGFREGSGIHLAKKVAKKIFKEKLWGIIPNIFS